MAKIPFTLEAWLKNKSQKVETRNGRPVHYIGLDRAGWQVFEVFRTNGTSEYRTYHDSYLYSGPGESTFDLFIVTPEPELTSWEKFISGCLQKHGLLDCGASDRIAKECSAELLDLARTELICQGNFVVSIEEFEKCFIEAQEKGRKEALKDLPRWENVKIPATDIAKVWVDALDSFWLQHKNKKILVQSLEKLPGFKED